MQHPSIDTLLGDTAANRQHLDQCADCRRMASLVNTSASHDEGPRAVPIVERSVFSSWEELPDGRGGMGKLWRAFDERLGRHVALKQIRSEDGAGDGAELRELLLRRLEREARMTARLQHPAIVAIYEVGRFPDGELFYAMPLVAGRPLGKEIDARPRLSQRLALLPQLTQIAEAVAYSHEKGVLHRDLKPDNILIGAFGEAVLIDWGLAKELEESAPDDRPQLLTNPEAQLSDGLTELGVGTPQYMAPEQARGEEPSPLLDVYGLGSTLYHLLAGGPPYGYANGRKVREALLRGPPRPLAELVPEAPVELIHLCEQAMSRDPGARFASARELAEELRRFLTGRLLESRSYSPAELLAHFIKRHRTPLLVAALALLVLAVLGSVSVVNIRRQRDRAEASERQAARALRRAQGPLASKLSLEAPRRLEAIALGLRAVGAALIGPSDGPPSQEATQGLFDALAAGPAPLALHHPGSVTDFAVSPDGKTFAGTGDDRSVLLWDARSGRRLGAWTSQLQTPHEVRFSPRGDRVSVCGGERAELHELATGGQIDLSTQGYTACGFLPDGTFVTAARTVTLRDPNTGAALLELPMPTPTERFAVSSQGHIAIAGEDGSLRVWSARAPAFQLLAAPGAPVTSLAFDPPGAQLVMVRRDEGVHVWTALGAGFTPSIDSTESSVHSYHSRARFSPDGRLLYVPLWSEEEIATQVFDTKSGARLSSAHVFAQEWAGPDRFLADARGTFAIVDAQDGRSALSLFAHPDEVKAAAWLGDGAASASREGDEYLWDLRSGIASGLLLGHTAEVSAALLDPAQTRLLTASFDGTVRIWPLPNAEAPLVFRAPGPVTAASWSPDGARALTAGLDGSVRVIDLNAMTDTEIWRASGPIVDARFFPDGKRALAGSLDGQLVILELGDPTRLRKVSGLDSGAVTALAISPSGALLASAHADGTVRIFDAASGKPVAGRLDREAQRDHNQFGMSALNYADEDRLLLSSPDGTTILADAHTLAPLQMLPGRAGSGSARSLSNDHALFAAISPDGRVLLHDLKNRTSTSLQGARAIATATAFSRDGKLLATGSLDGSLRLYDVASGHGLMEQNAQLGPVTSVVLSADSSWVIAGYRSGAVRMHPANPSSAIARACSVLRRFEQVGDLQIYCANSETISSRNESIER
jgi:WD40 repeat protein/serine/threonine protein kinase